MLSGIEIFNFLVSDHLKSQIYHWFTQNVSQRSVITKCLFLHILYYARCILKTLRLLLNFFHYDYNCFHEQSNPSRPC